MRSNGWAVLAGTKEVTGSLAGYPWLAGEGAERLITAEVSSGGIDTMVIDGLTIYALGIIHTGCEAGADMDSPCIDHVAWLVETDGCRILHLGDAKVARGGVRAVPVAARPEIDIAFVPFWFLQRDGGAGTDHGAHSAEKAVVLMHWNSWNRDSVVEGTRSQPRRAPPTVIFSGAFEKMTF